ncbi:putative phospholipase D [Dioscorea sansibarensis]
MVGSSSQSESEGRRSNNLKNIEILHGDLDLWILEARSLPNMDLMSERMRRLSSKSRTMTFFGAQLIGTLVIPVEQILPGATINGWFPIVEGAVTLYQDAHVPENLLPKIPLDGAKYFEQQKCWEDICHAILEAHHLIYIVGWSIYHPVKLVREPTKTIACWRGVVSWRLVEDTNLRKEFVVGTLFTHHQKCVLVDNPSSWKQSENYCFYCGLDLCDGRYDTPEHRLFGDLDSVFAGDFHNPTFPINSRGPRQPWHDLHCRIDGPAAYDILTNFEQRWRKATKWRDFKFRKVRHWNDDCLIKLDRISWIKTPYKK